MAASNYCLILEDKWVQSEMEMALPLSLNNFMPVNLKYTHQKHISHNYSLVIREVRLSDGVYSVTNAIG